MSEHRCDRYALLGKHDLEGVTFCRKDGARAAWEVLQSRDRNRERVKTLEARVRDLEAQLAQRQEGT